MAAIELRQRYSFWDLHVAIHDAMGWLDCHLHAFRRKDGKTDVRTWEIGIPHEDGFSMNGRSWRVGMCLSSSTSAFYPETFDPWRVRFDDPKARRKVACEER